MSEKLVMPRTPKIPTQDHSKINPIHQQDAKKFKVGTLPDPSTVMDPTLRRALERRKASEPGFKQQRRREFLRKTIEEAAAGAAQDVGRNTPSGGTSGSLVD